MTLKYLQALTQYQAGSGNIIGATTVVLTSLTDIYGNAISSMTPFGSKGYITLEPDTNNEEGATFTGITANANGTVSLTGVSTILAQSPYTETSGLVRQHSGGTKVVITDNVAFWNTFTNKNNDETIVGKYTFSNANRPTLDSDVDTAVDTDFPTFGQLARVVVAGAANASTTVKGIVQEATQAQVLAKTAAGSTGAELYVNPSTVASTLLSDYKVDTGSANAYVITPAPAITAYTTGQIFSFKAAAANTGASTLNVNGLGTKNIFIKGSALSSGDIAVGQIVLVEYDGTQFQMLSQAASGTPTGMISPYAGFTAPSGWLICNGSAVSRTTYSNLFALLTPSLGTFTVTIASPGLVTLSAHGLSTGDAVYFTTTGALPTGLSINTQYWVIKNDANSFWLATSLANALVPTKINTSGSQSGTHTAVRCPYGVGDGSTTFNIPNLKSSVPVGLDTAATEFAGVGQTGGEKTHTLVVSEMPAHTHSIAGSGANTGIPLAGGGSTASGVTGSTGGDGAHNNLQPYISLNYIIKT